MANRIRTTLKGNRTLMGRNFDTRGNAVVLVPISNGFLEESRFKDARKNQDAVALRLACDSSVVYP